jgi:malate synthase
MDCEDSVAAVDGEDKALAYRNWLGLMKGDLEETFQKGGKTITRKLHGDFEYKAPDGEPFMVKTRSLMLVRNVGHLMTTPAVLDKRRQRDPRRHLDGMCTAMIAMHDLEKGRPATKRNSRRLGLYREAENARPGRSRFLQRAVQSPSKTHLGCRATR